MSKSFKIIRYLVLGGLFLMPFLVLIVPGNFFFPFITGKNFAFRILVEIIFGLWLILAIFDKNYRPRKTWVLIAVSCFVFLLALSSIFGENFYHSFWSNYERMEGLITYLHLFAFFLILISVMRDNLWKWFFNTSLGVSVIIGIYGILQMAGKLPVHQGGDRLDATLGNAIYLSVYMIFHVFLALFLFFKESLPAGRQEWYRWFYLPVAVLDLIILYHTATRGAILGLIGGFILAALLAVFFYPSRKVKIFSGAVLGLVVLLVAGFLIFKNSSFVTQSPVLLRFSSISIQEPTTQSRIFIWKLSLGAFKEKPILGWGPENFNLAFNKYYDPILWSKEPWFDRAHNVFVDRLIAGGLPGLLAYLGLFVSAIYYLWSPKANLAMGGKNRRDLTESVLLTSMFAAYLFHNIFVFDNLISSILFFIFLAYIASKSQEAKLPLGSFASKSSKSENLGVKSSFALIIGVATLFIIYYANVPAILANLDLLKAMRVSATGSLQDNLSLFQKAISRNSFGTTEAREQLSGFTSQILSNPEADSGFKETIFNLTVSEMKKQISQSPTDIRYQIFLGGLYNRAQQYDLAIPVIENAIKFSPKKQQLYFELGASHLNKKEYKKALEVLKTAFDLSQDFPDARKLYAVAAIFAGKDKLAQELMKDYGGIIIADEKFLQAFNSRKMFVEVAGVWEKFIEKSPQNPRYHLGLAASYLQIGERQKAIEQIQKAIELEPGFKQQGEYYIDEIRAGRNP